MENSGENIIGKAEDEARKTFKSLPKNARDAYSILEGTYNNNPALRRLVEESLRRYGSPEIPMAAWDTGPVEQMSAALIRTRSDLVKAIPLLTMQPTGSVPMLRRKMGSGVSIRTPPLPLLLQRACDSFDPNIAANYNAPRGSAPAVEAVSRLEGLLIGDEEAYRDKGVFINDGGATNGVYRVLNFIRQLSPDGECISLGPNYFLFFREANLQKLSMKLCINREVEDRNNGTVQFLPTPAEIASSLTPNTRALVVTQPNNPTGEFYSRSDLQEIVRLACERNLIIIDDAAFEELVFDEQKAAFASVAEIALQMNALDRVITLKSFSKGKNFPASRTGYILTTNQDFIDYAENEGILQYDSPTLLNMGMICLDSLLRRVEISTLPLSSAIEEAITAMPMGPIRVPVQDPGVAKLYMAQRSDDMTSYRASMQQVVESGIATAQSSVRSAYNFLIRLDQLPGDISMVDFAILAFARKGLETQWGPNFGGKESEWRKKYGAWMRVTFSSQPDYMGDATERLKQLLSFSPRELRRFTPKTGLSL